MQFGIYPLSAAGTPTGLAAGPPDNPEAIRRALTDLGVAGIPVIPRTYVIASGPGSERSTRAQLDRLADSGLLGHVVVGTLHEGDLDVDWWQRLIAMIVAEYGARLASVQITNEPNLTFMEGAKPYIIDAVVHGVIAAKRAIGEQQLPIPVGFGSVPQSEVALPNFWHDLRAAGGARFAEAVDFVGHNFYVDVFEAPVPLSDIPARVETTLGELRQRHLPAAGLAQSTPIRVTENGWPTGENPFTGTVRDGQRQAEVLEAVVRTVHRIRADLNISHYMLFGLRDADSSKPDPFHQFGILRDDYSTKPAYATFKSLVRELG